MKTIENDIKIINFDQFCTVEMITSVQTSYPGVTLEWKGIIKKEKQFRIPLVKTQIRFKAIDDIFTNTEDIWKYYENSCDFVWENIWLNF